MVIPTHARANLKSDARASDSGKGMDFSGDVFSQRLKLETLEMHPEARYFKFYSILHVGIGLMTFEGLFNTNYSMLSLQGFISTLLYPS